MSGGDVAMRIHLPQRFDQFDFVSVSHLALNMAPIGSARKVFGASCVEEHKYLATLVLRALKSALSAPPAGDLGLDLLAGREVPPTVGHAATGEGQDIRPVMIQAQQLDRSFVHRQTVGDEFGDSVVERRQFI